jgi:hypothetical protein
MEKKRTLKVSLHQALNFDNNRSEKKSFIPRKSPLSVLYMANLGTHGTSLRSIPVPKVSVLKIAIANFCGLTLNAASDPARPCPVGWVGNEAEEPCS